MVVSIVLFVHLSADINKVNQSLPIKEKLRRLDFAGTAVFLGSVCCLLLNLQWSGQTIAWSSATSIGLFVGFGILAIIFCVLQYKLGEYATIPLRILKIRSIYMGALVLFTLGIASIAVSTLIRATKTVNPY